MDKIEFCPYCNEEHVVVATMDDKKPVGFFCNRKRKLINAVTTKWNGFDVYEPMREFARKNVNLGGVAHVRPEKVEGLARKMAFLFLQLSDIKDRKINYAFAAYHMEMIITRLRSEVRVKGIGGRRK